MIFRSSSMKHKLLKMEYLVSCVAFALLFLAHIIPSEAAGVVEDEEVVVGTPNPSEEVSHCEPTEGGIAIRHCKPHPAKNEDVSIKPNYDFEKYKVFDIRGPLVLSCNVTFVPEKPYTLEWLKDDVPVSDVSTLKNRFKLLAAENKFMIDRTIESDGGNYVCRPVNVTAGGEITAVAKPVVKLPPNTSVVEGEKLKIVCAALGNPKPTVEWIIGNDTYKESKGRVVLSDDNGVVNAVLTLSEVSMDDRGDFYCRASNVANRFVNATQDGTFVRVKDKLAALWPFLGICAEVFVLCAIILVYEKRRNKPDMEESDTDQSPDQKQTPDHGKDPEVRHRK